MYARYITKHRVLTLTVAKLRNYRTVLWSFRNRHSRSDRVSATTESCSKQAECEDYWYSFLCCAAKD
jgi:hypothetical protein